jgi:hypothetical protein
VLPINIIFPPWLAQCNTETLELPGRLAPWSGAKEIDGGKCAAQYGIGWRTKNLVQKSRVDLPEINLVLEIALAEVGG